MCMYVCTHVYNYKDSITLQTYKVAAFALLSSGVFLSMPSSSSTLKYANT